MEVLHYLIVVLIIDSFLLIRSEIRDERKWIYLFKPIATITVIIIASLSLFKEGTHNHYSTLILVGLLFSLGGDMALMWPKNLKAFRLGLASFLLAHIVYTVAFFSIGVASVSDWLPIIIIILVSGVFFKVIRSGLEKMMVPVIAYIIIITLMVASAIIFNGTEGIGVTSGLLVLAGAILFYISDLILAANRFWNPWQYNRISLAFYYSGQLLIALSAHQVLG